MTSELQLEMEKFIKITMAVDTASILALDEIMAVIIEEINKKQLQAVKEKALLKLEKDKAQKRVEEI